jgi:catechol 2,3-dioxygenase-like lactoylglutathione lyase family enzyme
VFSRPQVNVYSADVTRAVGFYVDLGFEETFRTPLEGPPLHVELVLDGFKLGIADVRSAVRDHALDVGPGEHGRGMEIVLWTDDTDAAFAELIAAGARPVSDPHDWLADLRVAWVADLDGNPIELVQRRG